MGKWELRFIQWFFFIKKNFLRLPTIHVTCRKRGKISNSKNRRVLSGGTIAGQTDQTQLQLQWTYPDWSDPQYWALRSWEEAVWKWCKAAATSPSREKCHCMPSMSWLNLKKESSTSPGLVLTSYRPTDHTHRLAKRTPLNIANFCQSKRSAALYKKIYLPSKFLKLLKNKES